jgi:ribosomal protein L3 glutamine methyltransferase
MTLKELIAMGAGKLEAAQVSYGHGTTNALDESAWLTLWALKLPLDTVFDGPDCIQNSTLALSDIEKVATLFEARINTRKPTAYLTQQAWLQGFSFYVDERVIVPRSLVAEILVDGSIDYWLHSDTTKVLDLCTGNGSLAVIAAEVFPEVQICAADLSTDALDVAKINIEHYALSSRIRLVRSDGLKSAELQECGPFDLILCNPPYVNAQSMQTLPAEYRAEPAMALDGNVDGGTDGMDFIRSLLQDAPALMTEHAVLVLEIGNERSFFESAFPDLTVVWLATSAGDDQVLLITRNALTQ